MTCRWFIPMKAQRGQHLLNENNVNIYWGGVYKANIDFYTRAKIIVVFVAKYT